MIKSIFEVDVVVDLDIRNGLNHVGVTTLVIRDIGKIVVSDRLYVLLLLLMKHTHKAVTSTQYKVH